MTASLFLHAEGQGIVAGASPRPFQFPGGEWDLKDVPEINSEWYEGGKLRFMAYVQGGHPIQLIQAALWSDVARRTVVPGVGLGAEFVLMLPYAPAARADRGTPTGGRVYANMINAMDADRVMVMDPHSAYIIRNISASEVVEHDTLITEAFDGIEIDAIICPDEGAEFRAQSAALHMGVDFYRATKHRDFETGKLSGFKVPELPRGGRYLVVDDICDGGGTFRGLAEASGVDRDHLALWVTHGVFSGPAAHLREKFRWIATTDSHPGSSKAGIATCVMPVFDHMLSYL